MKKGLLILLCLPMIGFGQNVNIPDANFKAYLVGEPSINTNGDSEIQVSEATAYNGGIGNFAWPGSVSDLTGIEYFTAVTSLSVNTQLLTSLDVSNNTALTTLYCGNNQLTSLDVSNNIALEELHCADNMLNTLDVSNNTALTTLYCGLNPLYYIDLSNTMLTGIQDWMNIYTNGYELNMNNMINLSSITCSPSILEINNNPMLTYVHISPNQIVNSLNINNNLSLYTLICANNQLASLDVSTNTNLEVLKCYGNQLTSASLNISGLTNLKDIECGDNQLSILDVSQNNHLTHLDCSNNQLSSLIFNNDIENINCSGNVLTCLDVNSTSNLTNLDCSNNMLEQLSIKNNNWLILDVNALSNNLTCVEVDNLGFATNNWDIDAFASFSLNCNYVNPCSNTSTAIQEHITNKELLKVTDILGRETEKKRNTPLFYIYNDGTVEKKIKLE